MQQRQLPVPSQRQFKVLQLSNGKKSLITGILKPVKIPRLHPFGAAESKFPETFRFMVNILGFRDKASEYAKRLS
jgi:hypothetical protein